MEKKKTDSNSNEIFKFYCVYSNDCIFQIICIYDYNYKIKVWEGIMPDNIWENLSSAFTGDWAIYGLCFGMFPKFSS